MPCNFITCDRIQSYLLPPDTADWLPEGHPAWVIINAVKEMDVTPFYTRYRADDKGQKEYQPAAVVTLMHY